jgi:hypothetical protein
MESDGAGVTLLARFQIRIEAGGNETREGAAALRDTDCVS